MKKRLLSGLAAFTLSTSIVAAPVPHSAAINIELELPVLNVAEYARPYVAIWLENSKGRSAHNIALWSGDDTEWLKDIRRWWRKFGRYQGDNIDGYSSATRPAGKYKINWDGTLADGSKVEAGKYTLLVEVVREHGGRDLVRLPIELGDSAFTKTSKPKKEVGEITLNYSI